MSEDLEDGLFVVEVESKRHVAERCIGCWLQIGADYDVWNCYHLPSPEIKVIARIDLESLQIVPIE